MTVPARIHPTAPKPNLQTTLLLCVKGKSQMPRMLSRLQPFNKPGLTEWYVVRALDDDSISTAIHIRLEWHPMQKSFMLSSTLRSRTWGAYSIMISGSLFLCYVLFFFQNKPRSLCMLWSYTQMDLVLFSHNCVHSENCKALVKSYFGFCKKNNTADTYDTDENNTRFWCYIYRSLEPIMGVGCPAET